MSQPRLDKAQLFQALGYTPHPAQLEVHRSKAPRRVLACGSRFGKTTVAVYEAIAALLEPRDNAIGWTVGPTLDVSDRVFKRVAELLHLHFKLRVREYSEREHRIVVRNFSGGLSELRGKSADRPDSLLGEGLDFVIVDEAAQIDEEVWERHLSQRLVDRRGWALLISTPSGRNYFWRLFRRGQKGRDAAFESWSSPSWSNPLLDRDLIEAERGRLRPEVFAEQYAGTFVGLDDTPCDVCGGPLREGRWVTVLMEGETIEKCPECKLSAVNGKSIVRLSPKGDRSCMVISLRGSGSGPPPSIPPMPGVRSSLTHYVSSDENDPRRRQLPDTSSPVVEG